MTGKDLTEQLMSLTSKSKEIRMNVEDPSTQIDGLKATGEIDPASFMSSLNVISFDNHLAIIICYFINHRENIVNHRLGDKIDIARIERELSANSQKISEVFQNILDNRNLIDIETGSPFSETLMLQLEYLNQHAS